MKNRLTDKKLLDNIRELLTKMPSMRDSDLKLITYIWYKEALELDYDFKTLLALDFLTLLRNDEFTSSESIRRCRQKVQELYPETRGNKYSHRHAKEVEVRNHFSKS